MYTDGERELDLVKDFFFFLLHACCLTLQGVSERQEGGWSIFLSAAIRDGQFGDLIMVNSKKRFNSYDQGI